MVSLESFISKLGQVLNTFVIQFAGWESHSRAAQRVVTKKKNVTLSNYERYSGASRFEG